MTHMSYNDKKTGTDLLWQVTVRKICVNLSFTAAAFQARLSKNVEKNTTCYILYIGLCCRQDVLRKSWSVRVTPTEGVTYFFAQAK